jgi:hypothetical protein
MNSYGSNGGYNSNNNSNSGGYYQDWNRQLDADEALEK